MNTLKYGDSKVKLSTILATAGAVIGVSGEADALDIFYSGPITSNNVVGFNPTAGSTVSTYAIQLKSHNAAIRADTNTILATKRVLMAKSTALSFRAARMAPFGYLTNPAQTFAAGATWAARAAGSGTFGNIVLVSVSNGSLNFGRPASSTVSNKYLLFKFTDSAEDYYGWIDIDYINTGTSVANLNQTATVKSYAWQKGTLGVLPAGVVPVPEPSSLITSGMAALAGGATALRRWRRERKTSQGAA